MGNYMQKLFLGVISLLWLFISSCGGDDSTNPSTNQPKAKIAVVSTNLGEFKYEFGEGTYSPANILTRIKIAATDSTKDGPDNVIIVFRGNKPGKYDFNVLNSVILKINNEEFRSVSGFVEISEYWNVGSNIKGKFSGVLKNVSGSKIVTVDSALFTVIRLPDIVGDEDYLMNPIVYFHFSFDDGSEFKEINQVYLGKAFYDFGLVKIDISDVNPYHLQLFSDLRVSSTLAGQIVYLEQFNGYSFLNFKIDERPYYVIGQVKINKFGLYNGEVFEFEISGDIMSPSTLKKVGQIIGCTIKAVNQH